MYFHDEVNLICTVSYLNFMCEKSYATLLVSMKLLKVSCASLPVPIFFIYLPASVSLTFLRQIGIWLWQLKSLLFRDHYNNNLMIITADDLRSWCLFCCVSVCLSFYLYVQKMCISHWNGMILAGTHNNTMLQLHSIYKWFCFENGEIIVN